MTAIIMQAAVKTIDAIDDIFTRLIFDFIVVVGVGFRNSGLFVVAVVYQMNDSETTGGGLGALSAKSVQGFALTLERIDHVHGRHRLAACVLRVRDGIADAIFQKHLEHSTRFFINQSTDTFHSTTTGQTTNGRLGNALDIVAQDLSVTLGAALSELSN
jgi:hypothetical protein